VRGGSRPTDEFEKSEASREKTLGPQTSPTERGRETNVWLGESRGRLQTDNLTQNSKRSEHREEKRPQVTLQNKERCWEKNNGGAHTIPKVALPEKRRSRSREPFPSA